MSLFYGNGKDKTNGILSSVVLSDAVVALSRSLKPY